MVYFLNLFFYQNIIGFVTVAIYCIMAVKLTLKTIDNKIIEEYDENLTYLNLSGRALKIAPKINIFKNLTVLDMSNNRISIIPHGIGELINLTQLFLHNNKIIDIPAEIGKLINLTQLFLHNNKIIYFSTEIYKLTRLRELSLHKNKLKILPNFNRFVFLSCYDNPLKISHLIPISSHQIIFIYKQTTIETHELICSDDI